MNIIQGNKLYTFSQIFFKQVHSFIILRKTISKRPLQKDDKYISHKTLSSYKKKKT